MTRTLRLLLPALLVAGVLAPAALLPLAPAAQAQDKVGTTAAQFLGLGLGARATGMGGANVASVEGPSALYWNPSAITGIAGNAAEFSQAEWFVDTRLQHAGVVVTTRMFHLGIAVTNLDYGQTEVTTIAQPNGTGELWAANDLAVGVTLARALTDRFSVGGTVKIVRQQVWNEAAQGGALDLGVTYDTGFQGVRLGMSMLNFGTSMRLAGPDLRRAISASPTGQGGGNDRIGASLEVDDWPMPLVFRVGISAVPFQNADQRLVVTADGNAPSDQAQSASFGAEYGFRELVFVRAGWREAFGFGGDDGWTVGFGLRYAFDRRLAGSFDYSFQNYEPFGTPQMFTLGLRF